MLRALMGLFGACLMAGCGNAADPSSSGAGSANSRQAATTRVEVENVVATLRRLEAIARANAGNRAAGTPGGEASIDEVADRMRRAGHSVATPVVRFPFYEERSPPRVAIDGRALEPRRDVLTLAYSPGGQEEGATAQVARLGCAARDFGSVAGGTIAVARRGECTLRRKALLAQRAGAAALLVIDDEPSDIREAFAGSLGSPGIGIPVLGTSLAAGRALTRNGVRVRLRVDATSEQRATRNVIAETRTGRRNGTIMVGAHIDSVPTGPGINDNGTGVATIVELAERLAAAGKPLGRRVRFAFWGAEELGLYGSRRYVASLSRIERRQIGGYVNLDMTGSPNPVRLVYDGAAGPPGSQRIEDALRAYFRGARLEVGETGRRDGSDHASFARAGIPVGGLFSGAETRKTAAQARRYGGRAGRPLDPCYHRACDTVANVDTRVLGQMSDATARAVTALAR